MDKRKIGRKNLRGKRVACISNKQLKYYPDECQILMNCVYNLAVIYYVRIAHIFANCFILLSFYSFSVRDN